MPLHAITIEQAVGDDVIDTKTSLYKQPLSPPDDLDQSYIRELAPESKRKTTAAARMIEALVNAGVDTFFGVPGGPVISVFDAILHTPGAVLIESRQEAWGAFAAAGFWRATGRVPAIVVTAGPGATNAVTGIVSAHLEGIPMVVICGDVAWASNGGRYLQEMGPEGVHIERMLGQVTRITVRVPSAQSASFHALAAVQAATNPQRPGPALIVLPVNHGFAEAEETSLRPLRLPPCCPPLQADVVETAMLLAQASRPLLVIGAACRSHAAAVRRLVDVLNVPFLTTPRAKGLVSEQHPRSLRNGGLAASWWARRYTKEGPDVVLAIGTDLDDCAVGPLQLVGEGGKLIHVDVDPTVFRRNLSTYLPILADAEGFVNALYDIVLKNELRNENGAELMREVRAGSPYEIASYASDQAPVLAPHRAIADLQAAAGKNAVFVTDIGEHMLFALHYLNANDPEAFHIFLNLGSMGSGICGAIGVALGNRTRPVVCVCGDGGMQMAGMEILVAIRHRLPIVFAVFNDNRYNMVYHGYKVLCEEEADWNTTPIDFVMWAKALGIPAICIDKPGQITEDLFDSLTASGSPVILDMRINPDVRLRGAGRLEAIRHMSKSG